MSFHEDGTGEVNDLLVFVATMVSCRGSVMTVNLSEELKRAVEIAGTPPENGRSIHR